MKKIAISVIVVLLSTILFLGACEKEEEYKVTKEQYEFLQSISAEDYEFFEELSPEEYELLMNLSENYDRINNLDLLLKAIQECEEKYYTDM